MATNPSHTQPSPTSLSPFIPSLNHSIQLCNIPHGLSARPSRHPLSALLVWVPCLPARFRFRTGGSGSSPSSCVEAKACAGPHTRHCVHLSNANLFLSHLIPEHAPSNCRSRAMLTLAVSGCTAPHPALLPVRGPQACPSPSASGPQPGILLIPGVPSALPIFPRMAPALPESSGPSSSSAFNTWPSTSPLPSIPTSFCLLLVTWVVLPCCSVCLTTAVLPASQEPKFLHHPHCLQFSQHSVIELSNEPII